MYGPGPVHYRGSHSGGGCGLGLGIVILCIIVIAMLGSCMEMISCSMIGAASSCTRSGQVIYASGCSSCATGSSYGTGSLTTSTKTREKLDAKYVDELDTWYTDELGWFGGRNDTTLIEGMKTFYKKTGVQPYVYMAAYDAAYIGADEAAAEARAEYAEELYSELFTDEGHFLWVYFACENDAPEIMDGYFQYIVGTSAESVLDEEALTMFEDRLYLYYDDVSLDVDELLSETFASSGKAIMGSPVTGRVVLIVIAGLAAVIILVIIFVNFWKARKKQKNKESEDLEKILSTPLETFGSKEAEDLKKKYD